MMYKWLLILWLVATSTPPRVNGGEYWPQFRGVDGQGRSEARGLPLTWSEQKNVKWKTPIHGRAWSSPVIWENQIWLTTATEDGRQLFAVCVDRDTGRIVHDLKLFEVENPQFAHKFNSYASPTPVIDGEHVYVTFGSPGTAAISLKTGKVLWQRTDFVCNHFRGAGSSPILLGQLLIMHFDGSDHQFIVALDKTNGKTIWKTARSIDFKDPGSDGDLHKAYSTPLVAVLGGPAAQEAGKMPAPPDTLISLASQAVYGYNPSNGQELWRLENRKSHSGTARPVMGNGLIFISTGFPQGQLCALRPDDQGKVTEKSLVWKRTRNVPCKPSILFLNGLLFMIDDGGIASCVDAKTGEEVWRERIAGNYSASPVLAEGRIYFCSEEGKTTVIAADRKFQVLAENKLDDGFMASPAIAGKALFLRTKTCLYRIEE